MANRRRGERRAAGFAGVQSEPEIYTPFQHHSAYANKLQVVVREDGDAAWLTPGDSAEDAAAGAAHGHEFFALPEDGAAFDGGSAISGDVSGGFRVSGDDGFIA